MQGLISVNGNITSPDLAAISVMDRGFLFGDNVFETIVGFHGKLLDLKPHLERLRNSADNLGFNVPWSDEELSFELESLSSQVGAPKFTIRLVITRGEGLNLSVQGDLTPNKIIYCFHSPKIEDRLYGEGIKLKRIVSDATKRGATAKTGNYLSSILAIQKAQKEKRDDILWTNSSNEITEASTANVFFMAREGDNVEFITPPPTSGLLKGITRQTIMTLLKNAKIPCIEQTIYSDELPRFDEAFLCSTVRGLVPIAEIDRQKFYTRRPNSVFQHIERLFLTWVESELGFRVDWNSGNKVASREV